MAAPATPEKVKATPDAAESPTTARPLDFDDDQQETGVTTIDTAETSNPTPPSKPPRTSSMQHNARSEEEEQPPPKPPRPSSPQQHAENTLIEAFPSIDSKVVKAVLVASGGQVEPAFNALLSTHISCRYRPLTMAYRLRRHVRPRLPAGRSTSSKTTSASTTTLAVGTRRTICTTTSGTLQSTSGPAARYPRDGRAAKTKSPS